MRDALVTATGVSRPDRAQLAAAFDLRCEQLRTRLGPLFGTTAISALFARALALSTMEFPWLAHVVPNDGARCSLDALLHDDTLQPSLEEGLASVLAHDIGLLIEFIGDDLVMPLVEDAWGAPLVGGRETRSEDNDE